MRRPKMSETSLGRPSERFSAMVRSKKARPRAGRSSTRVREYSTWFIDSSQS